MRFCGSENRRARGDRIFAQTVLRMMVGRMAAAVNSVNAKNTDL